MFSLIMELVCDEPSLIIFEGALTCTNSATTVLFKESRSELDEELCKNITCQNPSMDVIRVSSYGYILSGPDLITGICLHQLVWQPETQVPHRSEQRSMRIHITQNIWKSRCWDDWTFGYLQSTISQWNLQNNSLYLWQIHSSMKNCSTS